MIEGLENKNVPQPEAEKPCPLKSGKYNPLLLAMNIVLLLALIILYFMFFKAKNSAFTNDNAKFEAKTHSGMRVAYINNDSIVSKYELVKKMHEDFKAKTQRLEGEVAAKQKAFEKDAAYFQEQVNKKTISEQSAQQIYGKLQQEQQRIMELRNRYMADLQQSEMQMNMTLLDTVTNFLKRYNKDGKFDYILSYTKGGNVLLANDSLDITNSVVRALNEEYLRKVKK